MNSHSELLGVGLQLTFSHETQLTCNTHPMHCIIPYQGIDTRHSHLASGSFGRSLEIYSLWAVPVTKSDNEVSKQKWDQPKRQEIFPLRILRSCKQNVFWKLFAFTSTLLINIDLFPNIYLGHLNRLEMGTMLTSPWNQLLLKFTWLEQ